MNKNIFKFIAGGAALAAVAVGVLFLFLPAPAQASHCNIQFQTGGFYPYFFGNFENAGYVNSLLVLHFKLKTPYNDGRGWTTDLSFYSDECQNGTVQSFRKGVSINPAVQYFSIRFVSPTRFEIWDDETNTKQLCTNCTQDIPSFPGYYEVAISGFIDSGASTFHSSAYRISNTAPDPPLKTDTLPTPQNCQPFQIGGFSPYFFDNYEYAEYINGLLAYHFRFKTPYNDGRSWGSRVSLHDQNCSEAQSFAAGPNPSLNTKITAYSRYYSVRFSSPTHYDIWNDETNQKEVCDGCSVDIPVALPNGQQYQFVSFSGSIDGGASTFRSTPFPIQGASPPPPPTETRDPVIIIPGILGSSDKNGEWVIDPIFHTYDDLIETLKANGYAEGKDLFTMPYDWRQSNVLTALQLRDKINEVQTVCQCAKVDLVAHSMGGLVARQYIQSDKYENDVDQLIFLGTPHLGAPKSYLIWDGGETDIGGEEQFIKVVFSREAKKAGFPNLFDYVRNKPISSVQELLPIYDYLRDKTTSNLRTYANNYPQNTFLEDLKGGVINLLDRTKVTNIVGKLLDNKTVNSIRVTNSPNLPLWENGYPDGFYEKIGDRGLERGLGDGTVPKNSSEFVTTDLNEIDSQHNELPTNAEGLIFKRLTGNDATILVTGNSNSFFDINFKLLLINILSPIDILVTAPDGKRIGKDFQTGQEINEIDGAFYSGFLTDNEYLTIPNPLDGEYKVEVQGTGSGSYTVATAYISENASVDKDFVAETKLGLITELDLSVDNSASENLDIKPADTTPPTIIATSPQSKDYLRSETLPISVDVRDLESGVVSSEISFDDRMLNSGDTIDLFFEKLGNHRLSVTARDFVGNATSTEVQFRVIATVDSTISDIERAFALGWINNEGIKKGLLKKLKTITRIEKRIEIIEGKLPGEPKLQKRIEKLEKRIDKILGKALLRELEAQRGRHINEQAYQLLVEDISWLLNN